MAQSTQDRGGLISGINVTPLVDVTLVLLVIFMVTAKLVITPSSALPVNLPGTSAADAIVPVLSITLAKDGRTQANQISVSTDAELEAFASKERTAHPDLRAVIQADGDVPHRRVVHVMDVLGQAGLTQVAFAVVVDRAPVKSK